MIIKKDGAGLLGSPEAEVPVRERSTLERQGLFTRVARYLRTLFFMAEMGSESCGKAGFAFHNERFHLTGMQNVLRKH